MKLREDFSGLKQAQSDFECSWLGKYAARSSESRGRKKNEQPCPIRNEFQRDRDRILHSKAFRRLKHKTQVFLSPLGDHYRTRMTHTLEVSQIARTVARGLRLNEDLTEAIALGHDLGHTPFGHSGEKVLNSLLSEGFEHNKQSLRVVDIIENLNLTEETRDGILNHTGNIVPFTLEGQIVKIADRIAYLNHDIDDSVRAGIISEDDLPRAAIEILGNSKSRRITFIVKDIIKHSRDSIKMSSECNEAMNKVLRNWMFENVYENVSVEAEKVKTRGIIEALFEFYLNNTDKIKDEEIKRIKAGKQRLVADYIAGMTDRFAISDYVNKFVPDFWNKM